MARVARLFLILVVTFAVVYTVGILEQRETPIEVINVEWAGLLPSYSPDLAALAALAALNRDAAAQVALIGLSPVGRRMEIAHATATWLGRRRETLPQVDGYTARQQAILADWQRALTDYADGRPGSLALVQATSQANAALYADMMKEVNTHMPDTKKHEMTQR